MDTKITVTSPLIPPLDEFTAYLQQIWDSRHITNDGIFHQQLEEKLSEYLGVKHISLFTNGTLPLLVSLQALRITGEVITTPYSFVATTHSLWWNGIKPVFVDIDPKTGNLDPNKIEAAITPRTTAIMPVHVYGNPCDTKAIEEIASIYGLRVIYDGAHAFGVSVNGKSLLLAGDMSTLSFHATKAYSTIEGGAIISHNPATKQRIDYLKNFGFADETVVIGTGINAKLDEVRAAYGLLNLNYIDDAIKKRQRVALRYREELADIQGISFFEEKPNIKYNYAYFPIFVDSTKYKMTRDDLYEKLKVNNIYGRRYFYPLISTFSTYCELESARVANLPHAHQMSNSVICLPIHHNLTDSDVERVIHVIKH